jgi:hypothetical protein
MAQRTRKATTRAIAVTDMMRVKVGVTQDEIALAEGRAADEGLRVEVDDGEIVLEERAMTWEHADVILRLNRLLLSHVEEHHLGDAFFDGCRYLLKKSGQEIVRARMPELS